MKQELQCRACGEATLRTQPNNEPYPGEHLRVIEGTAQRDFLCDACTKQTPIRRGDQCFAVTLWADRQRLPWHPWEGAYLDDMKQRR